MSSLRLLRPVVRSSHRGFSSSSAQAVARMQLIGRLAAQPEVQATSTGRDVVRYAVGSSHGPKDNRQVSWFQLVSFDEGPRRDLLAGLPKGTLVYVEADSRMRAVEGADGKRQFRLDLVQRSIDVLSRPLGADQQQHPEGDEIAAATA